MTWVMRDYVLSTCSINGLMTQMAGDQIRVLIVDDEEPHAQAVAEPGAFSTTPSPPAAGGEADREQN
jgi:hypothetical protein